ncbi:hypothetical protein AWZ03_014798 [Drosophila navojoa]|uniref:Uncharacterized protein n=1 Tax=Drosophila navojoa TaxID=7232 RepID=A0A484AQ92_DRONA|nr:hypothetical protein AWZ03_014798 [Drosophila navojoa]
MLAKFYAHLTLVNGQQSFEPLTRCPRPSVRSSGPSTCNAAPPSLPSLTLLPFGVLGQLKQPATANDDDSDDDDDDVDDKASVARLVSQGFAFSHRVASSA